MTLNGIILEGENLAAVSQASEEDVRKAVKALVPGTSFLSLTREDGSYVQAAGGRPWCVVEYRDVPNRQHLRAYQHTPQPKYKDGAKIRTGAGDIALRHDEWFLLKDAAEIFVAFLRGQPFPDRVQWRPLTGMPNL
ncbi:MAG TPA: hypothetical protein VF409_07580 [Sphingomonas sp.]